MLAAADPRSVESLLAFWADAGVEACYADAPVDRIAAAAEALKARKEAAPPTPLPVSAPTVKAGPDIGAAVAQARELAAAAPDLAALVEAIKAFDGCGLKFEGARQAVVFRGDPAAPLMIIGEAPGADEDREGAPFVGRAGKLLDRMLAAAGLTDRVFITNTVYWRPPGNRTPSPAEQQACQPFLERMIALNQPRMLMLAGGAAAKSVLDRSEGILSLRGRWLDWTASDQSLTLPAMPTLHPAFLLRQPAAKKKAWTDLLTLTERLDRESRPS